MFKPTSCMQTIRGTMANKHHLTTPALMWPTDCLFAKFMPMVRKYLCFYFQPKEQSEVISR